MALLPISGQSATPTEARARSIVRARQLRVALVAMPFVSAARPSIQLGLLRSIARKSGFSAQTFHLNLECSSRLGGNVYEALCQHRGRMLGDWLFSLDAFGPDAPDPDGQMLGEFPSELEGLRRASGIDVPALQTLRRDTVPAYLDAMERVTDWAAFDVVGFSCTFQQTVASAAMARRIKLINPNVRIVFGGANLDGEMGLETVRAVRVADYGVSGEADVSFPAFLDAIENGRDPVDIPGVIVRRADGQIEQRLAPQPFEAMDTQPMPDYDEYFSRAEGLGLIGPGNQSQVTVPFESSRGCWWGQKKHCTFCGLNGSTMKFRAKAPERVKRELAAMARRYRTFSFEAIDNIMEHTYLKTLLPSIASDESGYTLFYEIKSNVSREDLKLMRQAGVMRVQPGIESLSSNVLRLMRKGVTASQNVNLLRWARFYGISVAWNVLYGFPEESVEDHRAQATLFNHLHHLEPPTGAGPVWLERFSPLFRERAQFPMVYLRPERSYAYVYPTTTDLDRIAYFFDYELEGALQPEQVSFLSAAAEGWKARWLDSKRPSLTYSHARGFLQINDRRNLDAPQQFTFEAPFSEIYVALSNKARKADSVRAEVVPEWSLEHVGQVLDDMCASGLMMRDGDNYLALAIPSGGPGADL